VPVVGWRAGPNPAGMAATARRLHPDLIVDAGPVNPERAAFVDEIQRQTGVPYILVDDSFARMPAMLRSISVVLGVAARGKDLAIYAEHAITALRGRLLIRQPDARPHVYYGRRADGLETALPGSPSGATIDEAGAINVAAPRGRGQTVAVSREQLFDWNPEIIIAEQRSFYDAVRRSPAWRRLAAVRNKRVYLAPASPFGWIDDPPGFNRLIGLYWLSTLFYPDNTQEDLRATVCDFYDKFYGIKLTNGQLEAMVGPAGVPVQTQNAPAEPLVGLGAAPPSSLSGVTPGTPGAPSTAPGAAGTPSTALGGPPISAKPSPTALCSAPTGMQALTGPPVNTSPGTTPGLSPQPEAAPNAAAPGVPPPGRRGAAPSPGSPMTPR